MSLPLHNNGEGERDTHLWTSGRQVHRRGKRRPAAGWPTGTYSGTVTFLRDAQPLGRKQATLNVTR